MDAEGDKKIKDSEHYEVSFINFSAYGATLAHLGKQGAPCTPLYNYLKPFPEEAKTLFSERYGSLENWSKETASPFLGMLNAGLQLFWLKNHKPSLFQQIHRTVFLPQYLSYVITGVLSTEYTGVGCHTGMWDFRKNDFHWWVYNEKLTGLLPEVIHSNINFPVAGSYTRAGIGIHDSSAALIPYSDTAIPQQLYRTRY